MKYANDSSDAITWNAVIDDDYWTVELTNVEYNGYKFSPSTEYAIIDSGTSIMVIPTEDFENIYSDIDRQLKCDSDGVMYACECTDSEYDKVF
jgi:hypothetical protein